MSSVAGGRQDPVFGETDLYGVYSEGSAPRAYEGKCTAPLLASRPPAASDTSSKGRRRRRRRGVLLSNESSEIVRLLDEAARALLAEGVEEGRASSAIAIEGGIALELTDGSAERAAEPEPGGTQARTRDSVGAAVGAALG